jgi:GNAT superfamily N-acetyltransferase
LTEADLAYLSGADGREHLAFAAVRPDAFGRDTDVLGTARCIRSTPGSETAELAMAVVDRAQGNGVGTALLDRLIDAAREQGIRRFRCEVLADNEGMRALAKRLGGRVGWLDDGTLEYDCPLPDAAPALKPNPQQASKRRPAPRPVPRRTARPAPSAWADSWERAAKVSVAFFETAALAWYDNVLPSQFGR